MSAVVVGAASGIGLALCRALAAEGLHVIASCRAPSDALRALAPAIVRDVELTDETSIALLRAAVTRPVTTLIYCAGVYASAPLGTRPWAAMLHEYDVNAVGFLRVVHALEDALAPGAAVGAIASRAGSIGDNQSGGSHGYRMSKAALNMAVRCVAHDLRPRGITVTSVHPGVVATPMLQRATHASALTNGIRVAEPDEVAVPILQQLRATTADSTGRFVHHNGETLSW